MQTTKMETTNARIVAHSGIIITGRETGEFRLHKILKDTKGKTYVSSAAKLDAELPIIDEAIETQKNYSRIFIRIRLL